MATDSESSFSSVLQARNGLESERGAYQQLAPCSKSTPDNAVAYRNVIDTGKQRISIVYNCRYMTNICQNVRNFEAMLRGQNRHPGIGLPAGLYTYDFDTGDSGTGNPNSNQEFRRGVSCPSPKWKDTHVCPEPAGQQQTLWRHDGAWPFTVLEPGTKENVVMYERNA
jgi:hypothetical protein